MDRESILDLLTLSLLFLTWKWNIPETKFMTYYLVVVIVNFVCQLDWAFSSVQSLSRAWLFVTPWTAARQASLSITNSQSLLKRVLIKLVMQSNHYILCRPFLLPPSIFPRIRVFQMSQFFALVGQSIGVSASTSVLSIIIQDWFPSEWTGLISLQFKGLSRVISNTTVQKHQLFGAQLSW